MVRSGRGAFGLRWLPALSDRYMTSGSARGHYFHQDLWAARRIYLRPPRRHIDVGSRIDGFVAHLLTFRDVEVLDVRALSKTLPGFRFRQGHRMRSAHG